MRRIVVGFSGGVSSAWCAGWALQEFPRHEVVLLFHDTKCEDAEWTQRRTRMATNEQKIEALILAVKTLCDEIQRVRNNLCEAGDSATCERIRDSMNALTKTDDQPATAEKPKKCEHEEVDVLQIVQVVRCRCGCDDIAVCYRDEPDGPVKTLWINSKMTDQNDVAVRALRDLRLDLVRNHSHHLIQDTLPAIDAKIRELGGAG